MIRIGRTLIIAALSSLFYGAHAEPAGQWPQGTMIANVNVGFFNIDRGMTASLEYVLLDDVWKGQFSVGVEGGVSVSNNLTGTEYHNGMIQDIDWRKSINVCMTPRATYGVNVTDQFEVHATGGMGIIMMEYPDRDESLPNIAFNLMMGCRYFFMENIAFMTEVGYSVRFPGIRLGLSYKF